MTGRRTSCRRGALLRPYRRWRCGAGPSRRSPRPARRMKASRCRARSRSRRRSASPRGPSGRFDGFVALGCVIRGETTHYDHICAESARGLQDLAVRDGLAIGYGILTCRERSAGARTRPARGPRPWRGGGARLPGDRRIEAAPGAGRRMNAADDQTTARAARASAGGGAPSHGWRRSRRSTSSS